MLKKIQDCFLLDKVLYSKHARYEMELEEFGEIIEKKVNEAVLNGSIIESYQEDEPYPSCLIYGNTSDDRPLHTICAYASDSHFVIIITVYQPNIEQWIDFERRKI